MKITIFILACIFVYVNSEGCTTDPSVCRGTLCSNSTVHCVDSVCTCLHTPTSHTCKAKSDCIGLATGGDHLRNCRLNFSGQPIFHCIDGSCHCEHTSNHGHWKKEV